MLKALKKKRPKNKIKNKKNYQINQLKSSDYKKDILDYKQGKL